MTLFFSNSQIQIYRNRRIGSANRFAMSATFTIYNADIQPASIERTQFYSGRVGDVFLAFVEASVEIKEGDQLVTTWDDKRYSVLGVSHWNRAGLLDHIELTITSQDG